MNVLRQELVHNRKREERVTLVYHPCAKFNRDQMHANTSEISIWSYGETSVVEWDVDLLWHMRIYTSVLTVLKGHESLPGMVYSINTEWDTLLSLLLCTLDFMYSNRDARSAACKYT